MDPAEERFAEYLRTHEYTFAHEPSLGRSKKPDFLVERHGSKALCEVKGFETRGMWDRMLASPGQVVHRSMSEVLAPVRNQIRAAARQLKPYADSGLPLVVVLANPRKADVHLEPNMVIAAMFGDLEARFTYGPDGTTDSHWAAGRNGRLRSDHQYLSAVIVAHQGDVRQDKSMAFTRDFRDKNPEGSVEDVLAALQQADESFGLWQPYYRCDVFEVGADGEPLPNTMFDGPRDKRWRPVGGVMTEVSMGPTSDKP